MTEIRRAGRGEQGYPPLLESIDDPPAAVWIRGEPSAVRGVAIVGTRRATRYGLDLARRMGAAVARAGWVVVSGLARGIDGAAHRGCLDAGGRGVAILGSGLDVWYPAEHRTLGESLIAAGGAVLSEYPPGIRPRPWHFPARNRLIVALSGAVVVVEAAERGGALITARLGAEMGRDVLAVPGDVDRATSVGTNLLIRDGAIPVMGADDLVEAVTLIMGPPPHLRSVVNPSLPFELGESASLDELLSGQERPAVETLRMLGSLEAEGKVRIEDGRVYPIT